MRFLALAFLSLACILAALSQPAQAHKRIALLIGNQGYKEAIGPLKNPHNDIELVAKALVDVGFTLRPLLRDAKRHEILLAVNDFAEELKAAGADAVGFLYYSGHGVASGERNYLVPVDVEQPSSRILGVQGVTHAEILNTLQEIAPLAAHYLVLDACRNNLGGWRGGKGFVPEQRRSGVLIAFAAAPGTTASDEGATAGPYATALAAELVRPNQNDLIMFHNVRVAVDRKTGGDQVPWIEDGIRRQERIVFREEVPASRVTGAIAPSARAPENECDRLAAHPDDPEKVARGVDFTQVEAQATAAISACALARSQHPGEKRFAYQLSRTYSAAKDYARQKELLEGLVVGEGYAAAFYGLGLMYLRGEGVTEDRAIAVGWLRKSAERGHAAAMETLGRLLLEGNDPKDKPEGVVWLRKAADAGRAEAKIRLGLLYNEGKEGVPKDELEAFHLFRQAVEIDSRYGCTLAVTYRQGKAVTKDPTQAIAWFTKAAERGCTTSMLNLGDMYAKGEGVPRNDVEAVKWYGNAREALRKSADAGETYALLTLANLLQDGLGGPKDEAGACRLFASAADNGNTAGMVRLGYCYYTGVGAEKDPTKAAQWYRRGADKGDAAAMRLLGNLHLNGEGVEQDGTAALGWLKKAADAGDVLAMAALGELYETGRPGVAKDEAAAAEWYKQSMENGHHEATLALADMYIDGRGVEKSEREGARLVRRAADAKFPRAMVRLGDLYAEGIGVLKDQTQALRWYGEAVETEEDRKIGTAARCMLALHYKGGKLITRDLAQAARWFEQAAREGCPTSMMNLAEMHAKGEGRPKDDAKAREWHAKARETYLKYAEQGSTSAMSDLAWMYSQGLGGPKDETRAREWFHKASNAGSPYAMARLADMLRDGRGGPQDVAEAVKWYREAADSNDATAMIELGTMYAQGRGVAKDEAEAAKWYRQAADMGNVAGMHRLAVAYYHGQGVQQSYPEALGWFQKGADKGNGYSMVWLGEMYELGRAVSKSEKEAAVWYGKAIEAGYDPAIPFLGRLYAEGRGVAKNETEARTLFRKAAQSEDVEAVWRNVTWLFAHPEFGLLSPPHQTATLMLLTLAEAPTYHERIFADADKLPAAVRIAFQRRLRSAGHFKGKVNGTFAADTKVALEAWAASPHK
jgi:TPR repeat protein